MDAQLLKKREAAAEAILALPIAAPNEDLYGDAAVCRLIRGEDRAAEEKLLFVANWFEHPHPNGRQHRGESDFAAIRMINALYRLYDRLPAEIRAALDRFYLEQNFRSVHPSENHVLMFRVSRLLAAQFYRGRTFAQYGKTPDELIREDLEYIDEYLMYRAGHAWGEFDSVGYNEEDMLTLNTLYTYAEDERIRKKAAMSMDMLLLDMVVDSHWGKYGGAHGRIYEYAALAQYTRIYSLYSFYFGAPEGAPEALPLYTIYTLSDYCPRKIVGEVARNRTFPYENRERKPLHCCEAWFGEIRRDILQTVEGRSIDKYLYLSDDYLLGSVVHQDPYPDPTVCAWYAHHQQHEWELTLPGDARAKIFSHHPGKPGEFRQHNRWTGDLGCCCGTHFCTKDTAVSLYCIEKEDEAGYINAHIPLFLFEEKRLGAKQICLKYGKIYILIWFSNGYRFLTEGETAGFEAVSDGRRHAFVLHVEPASRYASLDAFAAAMERERIDFDAEAMRCECFGVCVDREKNSVGGVENVYPYPFLFDSPYLKSEYGSGILRVTDGVDSDVYDFNF